MGIQISASNSDLFLNCQRPFDPEVELDARESTDAMNYGSAFAEIMAKARSSKGLIRWSEIVSGAIARWGITGDDVGNIMVHVQRAFAYWSSWVSGANPLKKKFTIVRVETPMATFLGEDSVTTRETKLDLETHSYDLDANEIAGTPDVCLATDGKSPVRVVLDDKTGEDRALLYASPASMGQLRTLALMTDATHVAVFHSPRSGGSDDIYLDPISPKELAEHHAALRKALARVGDGSMRPGPWCNRCPAKLTCPTQYGELAVHTGALVKKLAGGGAVQLKDGIDRGLFIQTWSQIAKLAELARDQIKEEVRAGAVYETPDGKTLELSTKSRENISLKSIREAFGKAGEEELERLRKAGAIKKIEWEEMRPR
jgi:hypothetical protein